MKEIWGVVIYKGKVVTRPGDYMDWEISAISSEMYTNREDAEKFLTTRSYQPLQEVSIGQYIDCTRKTKYVIKGFDLKD